MPVETISHGQLTDESLHTVRVDHGKVVIGRAGGFVYYYLHLTNTTGLRIHVSAQPATEIRLIGLLNGPAVSTGVSGKNRRFLSGEANCLAVKKGATQEIVAEGGDSVELVMVVMGLAEMAQLVSGNQPTILGFLNRGQGGWLFEHVNLSMRMEQAAVIRQVLHEKKVSYLRKAFLRIKLAEWYVLFFEQAATVEGSGNPAGLRPDELERMRQVQHIIYSEPAASYSLVGLAHMVGTNEATLKKHFKVVYGTTVFGYLTTCRMERAKALLVNEKLKVALVAQEVGYKYASHFSAAFRKYYGYLPAKLLRKIVVVPSLAVADGWESLGPFMLLIN